MLWHRNVIWTWWRFPRRPVPPCARYWIMANIVMSSRNGKKKPEDHDFGVKFKNAARFLEDGNKVKVTIMFRGREMSHPELGEALLNKMAEELGDTAIVEKKPKIEGRNMTMVIAPKKK